MPMDDAALIEIPGLGARNIETLPVSDLYLPFESIGNNCEFGIVQRGSGFDAPGLFRNVGFNHIDAIISVIERGLADMFAEGKYAFIVPPGWKDWRLDCNVSGMGFHTGISSALEMDSPGWVKETAQSIALFRYLKRCFLEDLSHGEKIFVFRELGAADDAVIERLFSALRKHGENWLLYVSQQPGETKLTLRKHGLLVGSIQRLSNENPPVIDFPAWEKLARESLAIRWREAGELAVETPRAMPLPSGRAVDPPFPYLEVATHAISAQDTQKPVFHMRLDGLKSGELYEFELWIYIPMEFSGTHISIMMWGAFSEAFNIVDLTKRETWQRLYVRARPKGAQAELVPSLLATSYKPSLFYSSGWSLTAIRETP